jgi:hypothetical protein
MALFGGPPAEEGDRVSDGHGRDGHDGDGDRADDATDRIGELERELHDPDAELAERVRRLEWQVDALIMLMETMGGATAATLRQLLDDAPPD